MARSFSHCNMISVFLDDTNYTTWFYQMHHYLKGHGLLKLVDGSYPCPSPKIIRSDGSEEDNSAAYEKWCEQDSNLISILSNSLSPEPLQLVVGCQSSYDMWNRLRQRYASVSESHVIQLKSELHKIQKGGDTIEKYLLRFKNICDKLAVMGVTMSDQDIKILILAGLPSEYGHTRQVIRLKPDIDIGEVRSLLLSAESEFNLEHAAVPVSPFAAMMAHPPQASSWPSYCTPVHWSSQCHGHSSMSQPSHAASGFMAPPGFSTPAAVQGFSPAYSGSSSSSLLASGTPSTIGFVDPHNPSSHAVQFSNNSSDGASAFYSTNKPNHGSSFSTNYKSNGTGGRINFYKNVVCQICEKMGHSAQRCSQRNTTQSGGSTTVECQICRRSGHSAKVCRFRNANQGNQTSNPPAAMMAHSTPSSDVWLIDSGASSHMTSDIQNLQHVTTYNSSDVVQIGQGDRKNSM